MKNTNNQFEQNLMSEFNNEVKLDDNNKFSIDELEIEQNDNLELILGVTFDKSDNFKQVMGCFGLQIYFLGLVYLILAVVFRQMSQILWIPLVSLSLVVDVILKANIKQLRPLQSAIFQKRKDKLQGEVGLGYFGMPSAHANISALLFWQYWLFMFEKLEWNVQSVSFSTLQSVSILMIIISRQYVKDHYIQQLLAGVSVGTIIFIIQFIISILFQNQLVEIEIPFLINDFE